MQHSQTRPTTVRYWIVGVTTLASFMLYWHRTCIAEVLKYDAIVAELSLTSSLTGWTLSGFFLTYALFQVPSGWLSDRLGARAMFSLYIVAWSVCTAGASLAGGFWGMLVARLGLGVAQAGAYPTSGALISRWVPVNRRGLSSGLVTAGGRLGVVVTLALTAQLIADDHMSWRTMMALYGVLGVAVGGLVWIVCRNAPADHPWCNEAERALIARGGATSAPTKPPRVPWRALLTSSSMWLMCVAQFGTNVGWVFLITWMPKYLQALGAEDKHGGRLTGMAQIFGLAGMLMGGWLTDWALHRFGLRWGRCLPMAVSRFVGAAAYLVCMQLQSAWAAALALGFVAFATDIGVGATWGYAQDVGGRSVGSVLGWGNMWGNLGAFASGPLFAAVIATPDKDVKDWNRGLLFLAAAFVVSGLAALGVDATKKISPETDSPPPT